MTLAELSALLQSAVYPEEIFGNSVENWRKEFRSLTKICHPDLNKDKVLAALVFKSLCEWEQQAKGKEIRKTYGAKNSQCAIIHTNTNKYEVMNLLAAGDIANVYVGRDKDGKEVLLKICRTPSDTDLMLNEAKVLQAMWNGPTKDLKAMAHIPKFVETFGLIQGNKNFQINIFEYKPGYYTLDAVNKAYPKGVGPKDMAWMWNRMFGAMLMAHQSGFVHGSIIPTNFLINPKDHNGILIDWCYAAPIGQPLKAFSQKNKAYYPPEVWSKSGVKEGSDIYMSALNMIKLLGGDEITTGIPANLPKEITGLLRYSMIHSLQYRASNVFNLHSEFRDVLKNLYGPPSFTEFKMPSK